MDRIEKALQKLSAKERSVMRDVLRRILAGDLLGLDLKKLKGTGDIYRIRKADMRIIFQRRPDGGIAILAVERRSDTTYRNF